MSKVYPGDSPVEALAPTTLSINRGEALAVVGPSGSGKSTLLNLLGLLDRPTFGSLRLQGTPTEELSESQRTAWRGQVLGFVFQAFHLLDDRNVLGNVELGMLYGPIPPKERAVRAIEAVERVGLSSRARAHPSTLSGGERQRVAIARAIAPGPRILLCDEPTGNLDSVNSKIVLDLLLSLNADGVTLIVVTHDPTVAARLPRHLTVRDGVVT